MIKHETQAEDMPVLPESHQTARGRSIEETIKHLRSENAAEREEAEQALRSVLEKDVRAIQRNRLLLFGIVTVCLGTALSMQLVDLITDGRPDLYAYSYLIWLVCLGLEAVVAARQRKIGRRLATLDAPQVVGPLVEALVTSGIFRWSDIRKALVRLLPRLKASDAKWLTPRQKKSLLNFLKTDEYWPYYGRFWGADLKVAVLRALEQVGDAKAIPRVERLAQSSKNGSVRIAAQECLPFLRERVQQAQVGQDLLRASHLTAPTETLLRPASENTVAEPEQLLRPSSGNAGDQ